jgi:hypothetical protein
MVPTKSDYTKYKRGLGKRTYAESYSDTQPGGNARVSGFCGPVQGRSGTRGGRRSRRRGCRWGTERMSPRSEWGSEPLCRRRTRPCGCENNIVRYARAFLVEVRTLGHIETHPAEEASVWVRRLTRIGRNLRGGRATLGPRRR